jgi:hypothetical protein
MLFSDDSGYWGSGGLFTAISRRSKTLEEHYELAGEMKGISLFIVLICFPTPTPSHTDFT